MKNLSRFFNIIKIVAGSRKTGIIVVVILLIVIGGWFLFNNRASQPTTANLQNIAPGTTELVACPVTGEKIAKDKAYSKVEYKGKTYYFCCAGCPEKFMKNPEKYVK
ncbi:YHS domain-containing protein [Candidatus Saganbacteria bacterium]|nr:YHS domain-containing protein [Candidatus Saganbacteria bacterium]